MALIAVLAASTGDDPPEQRGETAPPSRTATQPDVRSPGGRDPMKRPLAVGLTESNASLLWSRAARPSPEAGFGAWRDRVEALRPAYFRLLVDWSKLQPTPDRPADLDRREDGCLRGLPPCAPFGGIRDVLRAVRTQQQAHGAWEVVVTIYGVPEWAAIEPGGCERQSELPRSRPVTARGLRAYRRLVGDLVRAGEATGVQLRWWSPWNEPNQPYFVSPQRGRCSADAPSRAVGTYAKLVRAARAELRAAGGERRLVLGETATVGGPGTHVTGVAELVRELPRDVACAGDVWAQHAYAEPEASAARAGRAVAELERALDRRSCTRDAPIWVTETGVAPGGCRALAAALGRWARDRRVDAAFQYTFREDTAFRVGLADAGLERVRPAYRLWRAWSRDRRASAGDCG